LEDLRSAFSDAARMSAEMLCDGIASAKFLSSGIAASNIAE